jgi:transcriptional accessory protein Tex/SPT6
MLVQIESNLRLRLWQAAEDTAVQVFAGNLRDLLLAAPTGARPTMGLDPGYRTGVKVAVVTGTGQVAATTTIYPHELPIQIAALQKTLRSWRCSIGGIWPSPIMALAGWRRGWQRKAISSITNGSSV